MVRKRIRKVFSPKIVAALLAAVISISNVQGVNAVVNDNADSTSTEGSASEDKILDGETAWVNGKLVTGNIKDLTKDDVKSEATETDKKAGPFDYTVTSIGADGQTITIPREKYSGNDDFKIYIRSILDQQNDPETFIPLQDRVLNIADINVATETVVTKTDPNTVGLSSVTIPSLKDLTSGDAAAGQILSGKKAWVNGLLVTGTMTNQGSKTASLNAGGSYTIPKGYHDGTGKITANSLATQTSATAGAGDILSGKTAYVNGSKITGTMANNGALNKSDLAAGASFTIPAGYTSGGTVTAKSLASQTNSATAGAGDILSGKTAYVNGSLITGSMTNQGAISGTISPGSSKSFNAGYYSGGTITANECTSSHVNNRDGGTITPGTSNQTITPGSGYTGLSQVVVAGDSDLVAGNIKSGVTIFGVTGSLNSSSVGTSTYSKLTYKKIHSQTWNDFGTTDVTTSRGDKSHTYTTNSLSGVFIVSVSCSGDSGTKVNSSSITGGTILQQEGNTYVVEITSGSIKVDASIHYVTNINNDGKCSFNIIQIAKA